ncbi:unnamed protein product [Calypogeia fissa]
MATPMVLNSCRRRFSQELTHLKYRHYSAVGKIRDTGSKGLNQGFSYNYCNAPSRSGFVRNSLRDFSRNVFCPGTIGRSELGNVIKIVEHQGNTCHSERVLLGLSQVGKRALVEIQQTVRVAGESFAAVREDVKSQGQIAWKLLAERGYLPTGQKVTFPHLGRVLKATSLTCVKYQVVPQTLAVVLGNATWAHQSAGEALPIPVFNGQYKDGITFSVFVISLLLSLMEGLLLILRAAYLTVLFSPAIVTAPFVDSFGGRFRETWLELVHHTLELAGAAFIKWGQWAATRPDLFPRDLCHHLSKLHAAAPAHNFAQTRNIVEGAFGRKLEEIFEDFEEKPVASGSIGQVHKAVLRYRHPGQTSKPVVVAVKVRHPGVTEVIRRDFFIINLMAKISTYIPGVSWLRLDESVQQFAVFMLTQVDLAREAAHLSRFIYNFRKWKDVSFPKPLYPLVHPEVLVETFEEGQSVAYYVNTPEPTPLNKGLALLGTNTLLKMLLVDNFIHADMHPGNILVRANESPRRGFFKSRPHVILLDVGMTVELSPKDRQNLLEFFKAIAVKNGRKVAESTLQFSRAQNCPDPEAFTSAVEKAFKYWSTEEGDKVHAGECIQELLEQVRQHKVNIDGDVCTVMVTTLVLEGWQRKLDPDLNIMDSMQSLLFQSDWATSLSYTIDGLLGP